MCIGMAMVIGRRVVLDTGGVQRNHEPVDLGVFRSVGIEPTAMRYRLLKSRLHYRAGFVPIARRVTECDGVGVTGSDFKRFPGPSTHRS